MSKRTGVTTSIHVRVPSALIEASGDDPEVFEAVWSQLPKTRKHVGFADVDRGRLFLKGQRDSFLWWLRHVPNPPGIRRELRGLDWMREAGVGVPDVIAWGEQRVSGYVRRSFLLLQRVQNAVDLRTLGHIDSPERRLAVIVALGEAVRRMHAAGLFHRELSVRNVLLVNEESPAPPRVLFIDCPRAERASFGLRTDFLRRADLLRLTRSAIKFGASENEASVLLESAGAEHPTTILQHARRSIAVDNSHPLRVNLWMILGI